MLLFQLYQTIGHFGVNFVRVCRHSNELSVTETNIGYVKIQYVFEHFSKLYQATLTSCMEYVRSEKPGQHSSSFAQHVLLPVNTSCSKDVLAKSQRTAGRKASWALSA